MYFEGPDWQWKHCFWLVPRIRFLEFDEAEKAEFKWVENGIAEEEEEEKSFFVVSPCRKRKNFGGEIQSQSSADQEERRLDSYRIFNKLSRFWKSLISNMS